MSKSSSIVLGSFVFDTFEVADFAAFEDFLFDDFFFAATFHDHLSDFVLMGIIVFL